MSRRLQRTQAIKVPLGTNRRERILLLLAGGFVLVGGIGLHLVYRPFTLGRLVFVLLSFALSSVTAQVALRRLPGRDPLLLPVAALLSGWGLLLVGRVAPNFLPRQAAWLMIATLAMLAVTEMGKDLSWLWRFRYTWLAVGLALLAATLILGVNPSGAGPRLWLGLGGAYFQPSEPLKLLMVVYLASYLAERRRLLVSEGWRIGPLRLPPLAYVGPLVAMFGLTVLLLAAQQDLGAAMLFFFTFLSMLYMATGQWGYVAAGLALFGAAGAVGYATSTRLALRIDAWLSPWAGAADWAFQIVQSLLAFGAGGILGEGLGLGFPTFIPAVHTDFTFAAIGESFGLVGLLAVIALYGVLLLRGFRVAVLGRRPFERFLAGGLTAGLVIQAWVIMAANVKLAPIAGVTLPFLSYGGSSLVCTFIVLGLLLRVSGNVEEEGSRRMPGHSVVRPILHLAGAIGLALVVLAIVCGYWTVVRADWLGAREDDPRRVIYERRIVRGRVLDRVGRTLAGASVGASGEVTRTYPVPEAAPVLGFASLRYGTGGIEAAFDEVLRGETGRSAWEESWADLLHRAPQGRDVQLTLDAELQQLARKALGEAMGAAVLLDAQEGDVLAMASAPTFDPARLGDQWEELREDPAAPLVNRATQGLYQPGSALQTVIVAEALHQGLVDGLADDVDGDMAREVRLDGSSVSCAMPPEEASTLGDAYGAACPAPVGALGRRLGPDGVAEAVERWRLTRPPSLTISTDAADWDRETISSTRDEAMGQGALVVSPLQMALTAATLANDGTMPAPRLTLRIQDADRAWRETTAAGEAFGILAPSEARELVAAWRRWGGVPGYWGLAVAGGGEPHAWFLGVTPPGSQRRYAVAVLLEHAADPARAVDIGRALLEKAQEH
ncbi:MAG: FtsW/RodA/SpoVE family cell cycle protein [Chloroflexota bacterium]